jgi:3-oxoacyl-[acyl-carrier-protein] synthase-3
MRRVHEATSALAHDPFQGVVERRVLALDETLGMMEERAAREAIARSGVAPAEIDLLLTHPVVPDYELANPACALHEQLQLSRTCLSAYVEATAYTVFAQLAIAEAMIAAGRARYALLVQSSAGSRLVEPSHPLSVLVGDAATALVLGAAPHGLLALTHYTDGRFPRSLVRERGQLSVDPQQLWSAQLTAVDACSEASTAALERAGLAVAGVDFLSVFQGTAWLHDEIAAHLGVTRAKSVEVFRRFGYLSAAAVAASLYIGAESGRLVRDDLVLLTGGGTGQTYGAAVLRWGAS